jgi:rhomboid protease GluP
MPPNIVTVGASGAIMGLFAASFVVSYHFPHGPVRSQIQFNSMQVLIASLLPLLPAIGGMQVDYGAHLGGAIAGAILGLILYALWDRTELYPKLRSLALIICVVGVAGAAYAGYMTRDFVGKMDALSRLIPESEIPASDAKWVASAEKLMHDYPDDPRGYFWKALAFYDRADYAKSESMVTEALLKLQPVRSAFQPILEDNMRGLLALAQVQQGHTEAAKQTAASICAPLRNASIGKYLDQAHLCD